MNPGELLRIVDAIHRDKNIDKEIVFEGIEAALVSAAKKHYGEDEEIVIEIDRETGTIAGSHNGEPLAPDEMAERIGAQTAKQVMIQKIREAERDALFNEYTEQKDQLVTGIVQRYEGGTATVTLSNTEAILPRSEQIPGETHHANERVRATVFEVRKQGARVRVVLSRTRPHLVARLFEQEIPEIVDGVIEVKAMAREPGYRTKVAVSSMDQRVDCVGACVGVRGNRIKNIVEELAGERIDIVRWNDDMQVLIPNALQPAEVEEVILCAMLGRAIVLVREDQLSLAIGRRGQNVRLASKLCGWDIEIMTRDELDEQLEQALMGFCALEGVDEELADRLVGEGFLTYDDLSVIEPDDLMEMGELTMEEVNLIVEQAEVKAEEAEKAAALERRRQRELQRQVEEAPAGEDAPSVQETPEEAGDAVEAVEAEVVEEGVVEAEVVEEGVVEEGVVEEGVVEEGVVEAGVVEAGVVEEGVVEEGVVEEGVVEEGVVEEGVVEAGVVEAGVVEEGVDEEGVDEEGVDEEGVDEEGVDETQRGEVGAIEGAAIEEQTAAEVVGEDLGADPDEAEPPESQEKGEHLPEASDT